MTITDEPVSAAAAPCARSTPISNTSLLIISGKFHLKSIKGKLHALRQFHLRFVMIIVVGQMSQESPVGSNAPGGGQGLVEAHMCWMGRITQGVEDGDLDSLAGLQGIRRNQLAIAQVSKPLAAALREQIAGGEAFSMG